MATANDGLLSGYNHIIAPVYSPAVPPSLIDRLHKPSTESRTWPKISESDVAIRKAVEVKVISDAAHPAFGQRGLFAARYLGPSEFVSFYIGRIHLNETFDTDAASNYDLSLDRELGLSIDAQYTGNEARFMNDYRGVAESPNAEFRDCWVRLQEPAERPGEPRPRLWERRMGVFVLGEGKAKRKKGIEKGAEVLVNYGRTFWSERNAVLMK